MSDEASGSGKVVDMHCHVGLLGDESPQWGKMSDWYKQQVVYKVFLFYGRIDADPVTDTVLREATEEAIGGSSVEVPVVRETTMAPLHPAGVVGARSGRRALPRSQRSTMTAKGSFEVLSITEPYPSTLALPVTSRSARALLCQGTSS